MVEICVAACGNCGLLLFFVQLTMLYLASNVIRLLQVLSLPRAAHSQANGSALRRSARNFIHASHPHLAGLTSCEELL